MAHVSHQPWKVALAHKVNKLVNAKVKVMVANAGHVYVCGVQNGHHVLSLAQATLNTRIKGVP